ncbi:hypothetical protein LAZ67_4002788 [Cordylochernes scorpioides]|uniref:Uncharacterized protein n=1 Tax=Cordylochernes scorpioides TaxID=51811 RepID=A0ABY6KG51_9ARAC|nr:hypothetical protein LAZ67_4002788 [Cordylochernes scorpioides]
MEVIDIQCYSDLKAKFIEVGVSEFYKYLPARFENTRKLAYEIMSMFGSTYRCEQLFSLMKGNKSPIRSRITDVHLGPGAELTVDAQRGTWNFPKITKLTKYVRSKAYGPEKLIALPKIFLN